MSSSLGPYRQFQEGNEDAQGHPMTDHAREAALETDIIGGFPIAQPYCLGCGKELLIENAWMTDGCPCNHVLGVNNQNETRWRLLMRLRQRQQYQQSEAIAAATAALRAELERVTYDRDKFHSALKVANETAARRKTRAESAEALADSYKVELEQYKSREQARYDGAKHARMGGKIEDCPYGPLKPTSELRDSTKMGLWQQGFDAVTLRARAESAEAALAEANARAERAEGALRQIVELCGTVNMSNERQKKDAIEGTLEIAEATQAAAGGAREQTA